MKKGDKILFTQEVQFGTFFLFSDVSYRLKEKVRKIYTVVQQIGIVSCHKMKSFSF